MRTQSGPVGRGETPHSGPTGTRPAGVRAPASPLPAGYPAPPRPQVWSGGQHPTPALGSRRVTGGGRLLVRGGPGSPRPPAHERDATGGRPPGRPGSPEDDREPRTPGGPMTGSQAHAVVGLCATFLLGGNRLCPSSVVGHRSRGISVEESLGRPGGDTPPARSKWRRGRRACSTGSTSAMPRMASKGRMWSTRTERLSIDVEENSDRVRVSGERRCPCSTPPPPSVPTDLRLEFGASGPTWTWVGSPLTGLRRNTGARVHDPVFGAKSLHSIERVQMEVGAGARVEARELAQPECLPDRCGGAGETHPGLLRGVAERRPGLVSLGLVGPSPSTSPRWGSG